MDEPKETDRLTEVTELSNQVKEKAGYVINQFEKRGEKIELLDSKAEHCKEEADKFRKMSHRLKEKFSKENVKTRTTLAITLGVCIGAVVVVLIIIIVAVLVAKKY